MARIKSTFFSLGSCTMATKLSVLMSVSYSAFHLKEITLCFGLAQLGQILND